MKKYICFVMPLLLIACTKNELGGNATISGRVMHHTRAIPHAQVYVMLGAREFPGTDSSKYDANIKADADGRFEIKAYKGDYYLYATGVDPQSPPLYVNGGAPVTLRNKEVVTVTLAVTEKH